MTNTNRGDCITEKKIILDLCGGTGSWSKFYKENGYNVKVLTLPDFDVTRWKDSIEISSLVFSNQVYGILAAPPCTMFSIARCDKTAKEKRDLRKGMYIVHSCLEIVCECLYISHKRNEKGLKFWALENPYTGYLKRFLGLPPLVFHPYEYGDPYTKATAIWGDFNFPVQNKVAPREFKLPNSDNRDFVSCVEHYADLKQIPVGYQKLTGYTKRQILRSMTPLGFAEAFYKANK